MTLKLFCMLFFGLKIKYGVHTLFFIKYIFIKFFKSMSYQLVELKDATANILCPICKLAVIDWSQEQYVQPCEHTLFIAMDLGFEFVADRFEESMTQNVDELHEDPNMNVFEAITSTSYKNLTILKSDLGVDGLFRYVGISDC